MTSYLHYRISRALGKIKEAFFKTVEVPENTILAAGVVLIVVLLLAFGGKARAAEIDNVIAVSEVSQGRDGSQIQFILTTLQFPDKCKNGLTAIGTTRRDQNSPDTLAIGCWAPADKGIAIWDSGGSPADAIILPREKFFRPTRKGTSI
jgi:hypothetical protein